VQAVCSLAYGPERKGLMARAGMVERLAAVAAACCQPPRDDGVRAWSMHGALSKGEQVQPLGPGDGLILCVASICVVGSSSP
jgi:hypothetical protein